MDFKTDLAEVTEELKKAAEEGKTRITCQHKNEPIPCHTSGHSVIDELIEANGCYYLVFEYANYNDNILMLLPDYCLDEDEMPKNKAVMDMADGFFEESLILDAFMKERPNTPFLIRGYCFDKCVEILKERLDLLISKDEEGNKNFDKFQIEAAEFDKFRKAAWNLSKLGKEKYYYDAAYDNGWKKYIDDGVVSGDPI